MARHHETQRSVMTTFITTLSAAIVGFLGLARGIEAVDWRPLFKGAGLFLVLLGFFGFSMSAKYYERSMRHFIKGDRYRKLLPDAMPNLGVAPRSAGEVAAYRHRFRFTNRAIRTRLMFLLIHAFIGAGGAIVVGYAFLR